MEDFNKSRDKLKYTVERKVEQRKAKINQRIIMAGILSLYMLASVSCGNTGRSQSELSVEQTGQLEQQTTSVETTTVISEDTLVDELDTVVADTTFKSLTKSEQVEKIQSILIKHVYSKENKTGILIDGTIRYEPNTRTFIFKYTTGKMGEYSLKGIGYVADSIVWKGSEPVVDRESNTEQATTLDSVGNVDNSGIGNVDITSDNIDNSDDVGNADVNDIEKHYEKIPKQVSSILPEDNILIAVKLNYDTDDKKISGKFITSKLAVYDFNFDDMELATLDIKERLENIMFTQTYQYEMDSVAVEELYTLSKSIDRNAKLSTEHYSDGSPTEVIYAYDEESETLIECVSRGDYNNTLEDNNAQAFVLKLYEVMENNIADKEV